MPRTPRAALLAVSAGGMLGSLARYAVGLAWPVESGALPWSTLGVNLLGALLLGLLVGTLEVRPRPLLRAGLGAGFLGGFTTFSALEGELHALASAGGVEVAGAYAAASLLAGPLAALVGLRLGRSAGWAGEGSRRRG